MDETNITIKIMNTSITLKASLCLFLLLPLFPSLAYPEAAIELIFVINL